MLIGDLKMKKNNDLRSENDNSREYREKRIKQTEALLKKALQFIYSSDKNFSHKNICVVMSTLATDEDKSLNAVISASAISKNNHYKQIIETYKIQNNILKEKKKSLHLTEGDLAFELHKCKTLLAQKSEEVKILKYIIDKEQIEIGRNTIKVEKHSFDYKSLLRQAYDYMMRDGLVFIDKISGDMIAEVDTKTIIANKMLLEDLGFVYEK